MADKSGQAVSQASETVGKISETMSGRISGGISGISSRGPDVAAQAKGTLAKLLSIGGSFPNAAMVAAQKAISTVRGTSAGSYFAEGVGGAGGAGSAGAAVAAAAAVVAIAAGAVTAGTGNADGAREGAEAIGDGAGGSYREGAALEDEAGRLQPIGGGAAGGEVVMEGEGQLLQPVGVKLETGAVRNGEAGTTQRPVFSLSWSILLFCFWSEGTCRGGCTYTWITR